MLKLVSWNVNGIRAAQKKGLFEVMGSFDPDILCLQETKAQVDQLSKKVFEPEGFNVYWSSAAKKGYSGVVTYTKVLPVKHEEFNSDPVFRHEGRIILTEFDEFTLLNVYFPNGGRSVERLSYKLEFYEHFINLIEIMDEVKPVIFCGDVNTAHMEIDLSRPKENEKVSGFMPIERAWIDKVVGKGFIDCFRLFHTEGEKYTWWDMKTRARSRNIGWRIDYFFVSPKLKSKVKDCYHLDEVLGSDHCPVVLELGV